MPTERFFFDAPLSDPIILREQELQHLRVMRIREGDSIEVINGRGDLATVRVDSIDRRSVQGSVIESQHHQASCKPLVLIQAIPRLNRLDNIVEKCTELGMTELWLFPGERSEKKTLSTQQSLRVQQLSVSAIKQCGRLHLPLVKFIAPITAWTELTFPTLYGDISPEAPQLLSFTGSNPEILDACAAVIGPESGLSPKEMAALKALGAHGVSLHSNILRTDTASTLSLGLLSHIRWTM